MPSSFLECCTLFFEVMVRKLTPSLWKEKWKKVNKSWKKKKNHIYNLETPKIPKGDYLERVSWGRGGKLCNNCFYICIHNKILQKCTPQSNTTSVFRNFLAVVLQTSKPWETQLVRKHNATTPPVQVVTITVCTCGKEKRLQKVGTNSTVF